MTALEVPDEPHATMRPMVEIFLREIMRLYWGPLYKYLEDNPHLKKSFTGFILQPRHIFVYIGQNHIAIEYQGYEIYEDRPAEQIFDIGVHDLSFSDENLLKQIIGFKDDSTSGIALPLPTVSEDFICPTNRGFDVLDDLGWNMSAQNSVISLNGPIPHPMEGEFCRIVNGRFFDADETGLITRHVKWMDFFPIMFDGSDAEVDRFRFTLEPIAQHVEHDAHYVYPLPTDYKFTKLPIINRFIEKWGSKNSSETDITSFLAEAAHKFIITMKFGATDAFAELKCEWQSQKRDPIKPDFFVVQPNGYADIVEFKLPHLGKSPVVGSNNRETFSAWLNSYVSQTRVYATYFDDPNNRDWFEKQYGFKVYKPRRWLVVGRRQDFDPHEWREIIADYRDIDIITFDDLVDGTTAQFYK